MRGVTDIRMSKKVLDQPGIHTPICQAVARRMAEHVRLTAKSILASLRASRTTYCSASTDSGPPRSVSNRWPGDLLSELPQIPQFVAIQAVGAILAALDACDMQDTLVQVDLRPTHIYSFAGAQPVPVD